MWRNGEFPSEKWLEYYHSYQIKWWKCQHNAQVFLIWTSDKPCFQCYCSTLIVKLGFWIMHVPRVLYEDMKSDSTTIMPDWSQSRGVVCVQARHYPGGLQIKTWEGWILDCLKRRPSSACTVLPELVQPHLMSMSIFGCTGTFDLGQSEEWRWTLQNLFRTSQLKPPAQIDWSISCAC